MSAHMTVQGNLGSGINLRYTHSGDPIAELSIGATHRRKDKTTGEWQDDGEPLWIRAAFFGDQAEHLADLLNKGDRVAVQGTLVRRTFEARDGSQGESLELRFPRFLGVVPKRAQNAPQAAYNTAPMSGTQSDPWAAQTGTQTPQRGDYNEPAPF